MNYSFFKLAIRYTVCGRPPLQYSYLNTFTPVLRQNFVWRVRWITTVRTS